MLMYVFMYVQWNLVNMNSRGPSKILHINRNFTITVASCISPIMPGDLKVVRIKQVFRFNSVNINEVQLYVSICVHVLLVSVSSSLPTKVGLIWNW